MVRLACPDVGQYFIHQILLGCYRELKEAVMYARVLVDVEKASQQQLNIHHISTLTEPKDENVVTKE